MRNKLRQQVEQNVLCVCVCGVVCGVCVYVCVCMCMCMLCCAVCVVLCVCVSDVHERGTSADTTDMPCACISGTLVKKQGHLGAPGRTLINLGENI